MLLSSLVGYPSLFLWISFEWFGLFSLFVLLWCWFLVIAPPTVGVNHRGECGCRSALLARPPHVCVRKRKCSGLSRPFLCLWRISHALISASGGSVSLPCLTSGLSELRGGKIWFVLSCSSAAIRLVEECCGRISLSMFKGNCLLNPYCSSCVFVKG